jgi:phosphohistidine swiveling domain-containing protein
MTPFEKVAGAAIWEHYLTRPFSLFETSVWNRWYDSAQIEKVFGVRLPQGLLVEYPKGSVRHYRTTEDLAAFFARMKVIAEDQEASGRFLDQGMAVNANARQVLEQPSECSLEEAVALCIQTVLTGAIFPMWGGNYLAELYGADAEVTRKAEKMRSTTLYPHLFSEMVIPAAERELTSQNSELVPYVHHLTMQEILGTLDVTICRGRKHKADLGHTFIYYNDSQSEEVEYTDDVTELMKKVEPKLFDATELKGSTGNKGIVRGRVRKIVGIDLTGITFEEGEILVAASTNPVLVPIMKKAAAIVTDEGGALCHAAVISRELGIPCVIGTKYATSTLQDGDTVEVDANAGVVRLLEE